MFNKIELHISKKIIPDTLEAEAEGLQAQGQPGQCSSIPS